jgi:hypothetical protein
MREGRRGELAWFILSYSKIRQKFNAQKPEHLKNGGEWSCWNLFSFKRKK